MADVSFNAYAALNNIKSAQAKAPSPAEEGKGGVAETFASFKDAVQQAEKTAMDSAVTGADPHAMVEALANAELVLDAAVTMRDKVVEAYQELLRMPV